MLVDDLSLSIKTELVFTSDINKNKITKDNFSSEIYEDKAERIFVLNLL